MNCAPPPRPRRRHVLQLATWAAPAAWGQAQVRHGSFGFVQPPQPVPALSVKALDGKTSTLRQMLQGRVTAVQLMFTGCSATCPIQGAMFAEVQQLLAGQDAKLRLLSLSIDPLGDDPKALRNWLSKFSAQSSRWHAALPQVQDVDRLFDFLRGRAEGPDRHTAQAFVFDRHARLAYRTQDMPDPTALVALMQRTARA
jgi:protein SCO1